MDNCCGCGGVVHAIMAAAGFGGIDDYNGGKYPIRYLKETAARVFRYDSMGLCYIEVATTVYDPVIGTATTTTVHTDYDPTVTDPITVEPPFDPTYSPSNPYGMPIIDATHRFVGGGYDDSTHYNYTNYTLSDTYTPEECVALADALLDMFAPGEVGSLKAGQIARKPNYNTPFITSRDWQIQHETGWPFPAVTWPGALSYNGQVFKNIADAQSPWPPKYANAAGTLVPWVEAAQSMHQTFQYDLYTNVQIVRMMTWVQTDPGKWTRRTVRRNRDTRAITYTDFEFDGGALVQTLPPEYSRTEDIWVQLIKGTAASLPAPQVT